ncbi:hypothetical protein QBC47DRAFT_389660 [Echria macrotheca]|uniref:Uncharacterized protein n=1 Tax=Echria macrotheca TaxID=438768 RepID=A0AAJ0B5J9_9PEZI|nr:hypothetical protein QBC47DRAFT_389660 [Echria macrotheca]
MTTTKMLYSRLEDWPNFDRQFQYRAYAENIWKYIDPAAAGSPRPPWPEQPVFPQPSDAVDPADLDPDNPPTVLTLTGDQKETYRILIKVFTARLNIWREVQESHRRLKYWCLDNVDRRQANLYFTPTDTITGWYADLRKSATGR